MNFSVIGALFYSITFLGAFLSTLLHKKSDKKLLLAGWLPATFLLLTCYQCLVAAFINVIHVPINTWSLGLGNGLLMTAFFVLSIRKKDLQKYNWDRWDSVFVIVLIAVMGVFLYKHYGWTNLWPNYSGIDASQHWKSAMEVYSNQEIDGMFYSKLFNGMLFQIFLNWIPIDYSHKVFVMGDLIDFTLAATMFYGLLREYSKKIYSRVVAILFTFMFVLGYQIDAILEGFVYLGMGVTLVVLIAFLLTNYEKKAISEKINIVYVMLALLGLILCYALYVPVVYVCVILFVFRHQLLQKKLISVDTVKMCLAIFLLPCIVGFYYSFMGTFGEQLSVGTQIAIEGAIYKDFFSNFIFVIILAIMGVYQSFHNKQNIGTCYMFLGSTIFMILLFVGGMIGKISAYYFYKMYFVEWALCFGMAFYSLSMIQTREELVLNNALLTVWILILVNGVLNTGAWIQSKNPLYDVNVKSPSYADIYTHNVRTIVQPVYNLDKQGLYHQAYRMMESEDVDLIVIAAYWYDSYWYQAFTNLRWEGWDFQDDNNYFSTLRDKTPDYVVVLRDNELYANNIDYFEKADRVYENGIGYIIRYDEQALQKYLENK